MLELIDLLLFDVQVFLSEQGGEPSAEGTDSLRSPDVMTPRLEVCEA